MLKALPLQHGLKAFLYLVITVLLNLIIFLNIQNRQFYFAKWETLNQFADY